VASYVLDFPVGKGKPIWSETSPALNQMISGWGVNGIVTLQSGFPLSFTANQALTSLPSLGYGVIRPNRVAECNFPVSGSAMQKVLSGKWFNAECVTQPNDFTLGNERRVDSEISGPGIANWDFAAFKKFDITDKSTLEIRAEFFNLFNRAQFAMPATQTGVSNIGSIATQLNNPRLVQFAGRIRF